MKRVLFWTAIGLLATATTLPAQRGRGGPRAYGDTNRDGICDYTGRRVGQGQGQGQGRGCCRGGNCPRMQQGAGQQQQQQQQQQQPPAKK